MQTFPVDRRLPCSNGTGGARLLQSGVLSDPALTYSDLPRGERHKVYATNLAGLCVSTETEFHCSEWRGIAFLLALTN